MKDPIDFLNDGKIREMTLDDGSKIYIYGVDLLRVLVGKNRETAKWAMVYVSEIGRFRPYIKWKDEHGREEELFLDEFIISKEGEK